MKWIWWSHTIWPISFEMRYYMKVYDNYWWFCSTSLIMHLQKRNVFSCKVVVSLWVGLLPHFWVLRDNQQSKFEVIYTKWKLMNFCFYSSIQIDDVSLTFHFIKLLSRYIFFCHPVYAITDNLGYKHLSS